MSITREEQFLAAIAGESSTIPKPETRKEQYLAAIFNRGGAGGGGTNGITPHIGSNGNWHIGATDTGVKAQGEKGDPGEQGTPGQDGKDGYTPQKGVDYWTEEDKAEIAEQTRNQIEEATEGISEQVNQNKTDISSLKESTLMKNQGAENVGKILVVGTDGNLTLTDMPESGDVVGMIDENNNIVITGNLADGTYTFRYENTNGTYADIGILEVKNTPTATYTNVLPLAQEYASSNSYIGVDGSVGYGNNMRISSSSPAATYMKEQTGVDATALIPVKRGDVLRFKNCNLKVTPSNTSYGSLIMGFDATKAIISGFNLTTDTIAIRVPFVAEDGEYIEITLEPLETWTTSNVDNLAYVMITTDGLDETSVITINEKITD